MSTLDTHMWLLVNAAKVFGLLSMAMAIGICVFHMRSIAAELRDPQALHAIYSRYRGQRKQLICTIASLGIIAGIGCAALLYFLLHYNGTESFLQ